MTSDSNSAGLEKILLSLEQDHTWIFSIMEQMPSGISIAEAPSGKLLYHNKQAVRLIRHPLIPTEDYTGYAQYGAMHDPQTPYKPEEYPIARALTGQTVIGEEMLYLRGDKTFTYLLVNSAPVRNKNGEIIAAISTFEDIGPAKQTEITLRENEQKLKAAVVERDLTQRKLQESEELFAAAFRTNPDALVLSLVDDGTILEVNETFLKLFGWNKDEVIGKSSLSLDMFADPQQRITMTQLLNRDGKISNLEVRIKNRKSEEKIALLSSELLPLRTGGRTFLTTISDITELKQAEIALKENERNLLDAQKLAHFGSYMIDVKNNNKIGWSDEMYDIWEIDKNEPVPPFDVLWNRIHPDDRDKLKIALTEENESSARVETEFRLMFPDDRIKYIQIITRVSFDEFGNLASRQGVEIDITERKLAQIKMEQILKDLERSNKELEQFAYVASHDLQEPLRMISSYLDLLHNRYKDKLDEKARVFINYAVDGAKRMNSLIKGLLSYSRVTTQGKTFEHVDLNSVLDSVLKDLQVLIRENNASVSFGKLPVVKADDLQMHQLFQNLITNAVRFRNEKPPEVKISAKSKGNQWIISVEDNGIGIAPEYHERIFAIFQRLHERDKYPGTGLGLAICRKIVERHNGRIWVNSQEGRGSRFYFSLPAL